MPRRVLAALLGIVLLWAAVAFAVSRVLSSVDGSLLGFLGTVALFYPTADNELRKLLLRRKRGKQIKDHVTAEAPRTDGEPTSHHVPAAAQEEWDVLLDDLRKSAESAISIFSWWHLGAYVIGLTLISAGFLVNYSAH